MKSNSHNLLLKLIISPFLDKSFHIGWTPEFFLSFPFLSLPPLSLSHTHTHTPTPIFISWKTAHALNLLPHDHFHTHFLSRFCHHYYTGTHLKPRGCIHPTIPFIRLINARSGIPFGSESKQLRRTTLNFFSLKRWVERESIPITTRPGLPAPYTGRTFFHIYLL